MKQFIAIRGSVKQVTLMGDMRLWWGWRCKSKSSALCCPEDGGSVDLWNVGIIPWHYTVSQPRRPRLEVIL